MAVCFGEEDTYFFRAGEELTSGVLLDLHTFCGGRIYDTGFKTAELGLLHMIE